MITIVFMNKGLETQGIVVLDGKGNIERHASQGNDYSVARVIVHESGDDFDDFIVQDLPERDPVGELIESFLRAGLLQC